MKINILFLMALLLQPWANAVAADDAEELALIYGGVETVSIATGSAKPLQLAPAVASVITARDIELAGATTLDEALVLVPGLYVGLSPFNRLNPNWSIRGIATDQTPQVLLLRDGVPLTHFYNGARPNLLHLSVADIERIEVMRGPGSAIYGADAFAGVVNIVTQQPDARLGWRSGLRVGNFEQRGAWLQQGGAWQGWETFFNLEWMHTAGDTGRVVNSDLQSVFDSLFMTDASLTPEALATGYRTLNASFKAERGPWNLALWHWRLLDAGVGAGAAQALDTTGQQDIDLTQLDVNYQFDDGQGDWKSRLRLSYRELNDNPRFGLFPPGATLPIGADGNIGSAPFAGVVAFTDGVFGLPALQDRYTELEWVARYTGWAGHQLRLDLGLRHEQETVREQKNFGPGVLDGTEGAVDGTLTDVTGTEQVFLPNRQRTVKYLTLQDEWNFAPDWELTAGVRYDSYSDFGDTVNPRLALVWAARYDLSAKLLYGRAFRAPSFGEQYARNNPIVLGNPVLEPETINSYEFVLDYHPRPEFNTRLSLFRYDIQDLIDYVPDPDGQSSTAQNTQDRRGHGLEWELEWQASRELQLAAYYAWQRAEDSVTGAEIPNTPGQMASVRATWRWAPDWLLTSQTYWWGDWERAVGDTRPPLEDYSYTHLRLQRTFTPQRMSVALTVRNVFDQEAQAPSLYNPGLGTAVIPEDYPLAGRSLWLELRYGY